MSSFKVTYIIGIPFFSTSRVRADTCSQKLSPALKGCSGRTRLSRHWPLSHQFWLYHGAHSIKNIWHPELHEQRYWCQLPCHVVTTPMSFGWLGSPKAYTRLPEGQAREGEVLWAPSNAPAPSGSVVSIVSTWASLPYTAVPQNIAIIGRDSLFLSTKKLCLCIL